MNNNEYVDTEKYYDVLTHEAIEQVIALSTWKIGRVGCKRVGIAEDRVVDYISIDLTGERSIRCYDIRTTVEEFTNPKITSEGVFIGEYNFYVIPSEIWAEIKNYIEPGVGCIVVDPDGNVRRKRPSKRRPCHFSKGFITLRILQSLSRDSFLHIEEDWTQSQENKPFTDSRGNILDVGDVVEYKNHSWIVKEFIIDKKGIVMTQEIAIEPIGGGDEILIRPSMALLQETAFDNAASPRQRRYYNDGQYY